jgi:hypothetical protein
MKNLYTEKDVLEIVESVINEIYTSPTPQPNSQAKTTTPAPAQTVPGKTPAPTTQPTNKSVGRVDPYVLRDYSFEIAPQLKSMAISLGANRVPVLNMITGIFERLSPQWAKLAKQKFMQLAGMTVYK